MPSDTESTPQKEIKNIKIGTVLGWIIGPLTIIGGLGTLATSIVAGIIYILTGLYIVPAISEILVKKTGFRLGFWVKLLVIVILWGIAGSFLVTNLPGGRTELSDNKSITNNQKDKTESGSAPTEPKTDIVPFKQSFKYGNFDLAIDEVSWLDEIDSGNQFIKNYTAKNKVLRVRFTGENQDKKASNTSFYKVKVKTTDGYEFKKLDDFGVSGQIIESQLPKGFGGCLSCELDPLSKAKEYVYFDLPQRPLKELNIVLDDKVLALE